MNPGLINIEIDLDNAGDRIDVFIASLFDDISRSRVQKLIKDGKVLVNEKPVKSSYALRIGDKIALEVPENKPVEIAPENIPLNIVFEDDDLIVINKPHSMLTHPAPGKYSGTLVNALLHHCADTLSGINGYLRPGIVHRLDRDTSGLIIVAKNDLAHQHLARQIQERKVDKYYICIVNGNIKDDTGEINAPIARHPVKREKMAVVENGRQAITLWTVKERFKVATFVECKLITGRTHQLRVHFSHINHSIIGDPVYGNVKNQKIKMERQALQAYKLSFVHPRSQEKLDFQIDFNEDINKLLRIYGSKYISGE